MGCRGARLAKAGELMRRRTSREKGNGIYNSREWREIRAAQLDREPYCRRHREAWDVLVLAVQVDHITPLSAGGNLRDPKNLRSLCASCHSQVTLAALRQTALRPPKGPRLEIDAHTGLRRDGGEGWW
jgi:5-methylcytosine-specific restriction endonuclease McrA